MQKVIVTYHKDCIDGTAAAAIALRKFPEATFVPLRHGFDAQELAPILSLVDQETQCYTIDCGLGAKEFLAMGCRVITLDHHIGAKELFETMARENANYTFIFDNEKSGATLAWSYFFPDEDVPQLIRYVEDLDLWKEGFSDEAKDVNNYLSIFCNDPKTTLSLITGDLSAIRDKGHAVSLFADKEIERQVSLQALSARIGEYTVPAFNITNYESVSGNMLAKKLGKAVVMFTIRGDEVKFSFRSLDGQHPTSLELAQTLGGGGHVHAAGATTPLQKFFDMITTRE